MRQASSFRRRSGRVDRAAAIAAVVVALLAAPTMAAEAGMTLSGAWVRSVVPSRPAAGYFTLRNDTGDDRKLVSASSPACGMLMLHLSKHEGGEHMAMVDSVVVPAHGAVSFAPGGYHLMCVKPAGRVKPGGAVEMTLTFDDGGTLTADFPVRNARGE